MNFCAKSELCIFDHAVPQVVIDASAFETIYPKDSISNTNVIEFQINGSESEYLDLNDTLLCVKIKVIKEDGSNISADTEVIPSNYLLHTLFKEAMLSLNNVKIEDANDKYTVKALIENVLNFSADTEKTFLQCIGVGTDEERKEWSKTSKVITLCGPLNFDFFNQPKYLIPGVNVNIKLIRNTSDVILKYTTSKDDKLKMVPVIFLSEIKLLIRRVKVEQSVLIGHRLGLEKQNAIYPIRKSKVVTYSIGKDSVYEYKENLFSDERLPKFVLITFMETSQINGDYSKNCSAFAHKNVKSIKLTRNMDYHETCTMDFEKVITLKLTCNQS